MKIITLLLLLTVGSSSLYAQSGRHEKIKAYKTAHITEALDLSIAEAEKFWPIYNAHEEKMRALRKTERKEILEALKAGSVDDMSDEQAIKLIDKSIEIETNQLAERKKLLSQLRGVIPPQKIIKLRKAEEDFKKKLLERYRERKRKQNEPE